MRRFALFAFFRDKASENAPKVEKGATGPLFEFLNQPLAGQDSLERDEDIAPEPFYPAILHCAESVRVRSLSLEVPKQACINPARIHFRQPYQGHSSGYGMAQGTGCR